jgi:hypothetical protein
MWRSRRRCLGISGRPQNCGRHVNRLRGMHMRINTRGQERPDGRQGSKGQGMPGNAGCTTRRELEGTTVRVQALSINQIKLNRRNSRTHSAKQIRQIANSMAAFGFTNPLLVNEDGTLIAGEGRYKAAQLLGLAKVPVIVLAGLSPARQRALAIADNKIAETGIGRLVGSGEP